MVEKDMDLSFFPPKTEVEKVGPVVACGCEKSQEISFASCEELKDVTINNVELRNSGRFLKVRVDLDNVCSGRKINLGVLICENLGGTFFTKGFRVCQITVPGPPRRCIDNLRVGEFVFVFPDENPCNPRNIIAKVIAHYADFPSFPHCPC